MIAAAVLVPLGLGFWLLGRWGLRDTGALVSAHVSAERRAHDTRALRRGARSCLVLGGLFVLAGVLQALGG